MSKTEDKDYQQLKQRFDATLASATRELQFALYGYLFAFYDMQRLTLEQFTELSLHLTLLATEDMDSLDTIL